MGREPSLQNGKVPDGISKVGRVPGPLILDQLINEVGTHDASRLEVCQVRIDQISKAGVRAQPEAER